MELTGEQFMREVGWWIFMECTYRQITKEARSKNHTVTRQQYAEAVLSLWHEKVYTTRPYEE
jgi:hypothetical protein